MLFGGVRLRLLALDKIRENAHGHVGPEVHADDLLGHLAILVVLGTNQNDVCRIFCSHPPSAGCLFFHAADAAVLYGVVVVPGTGDVVCAVIEPVDNRSVVGDFIAAVCRDPSDSM